MPTTVQQFVLETLTHPHIDRINFQYGPTRVYPNGYRRDIARAVRNGRIAFETTSGGHFRMNTPPGQTHHMAVPGNLVYVDEGVLCVKSRLSPLEAADLRGTIIHEATHALQDYQRAALDPRMSEGSAYLAGWMGRLQWGYPRLGSGGNIHASANAYARHLAARLLDHVIVYIVPNSDVQRLNALVTTGSRQQYVFNGL